MRLSSPELLVDITGLPGLSEIVLDKGTVRIGALVTHARLQVQKHLPLLAEAAKHVAHPAIRNRGTLGGSLALADPAAEYPACAVALQATLVIAGVKGERRVKAEAFFKGLFETDLEDREILVAAEFPTGGTSVFLELTRRHGDYAIVGLAAHQDRFAFFNVGSKPVLVKGNSLAEAKAALARVEPPADLYHTSKTKLHLAGVLLERAWTTLSKPH